jgi:PelA/Pel-15E family pectate lyase
MINVLRLLREIARGQGEFAFVDAAHRQRATAAIDQGVDCILQCQVKAGGQPAAWCAQHDEQTLAPAPARAYELVSLSGSESVGIVKFLMEIETPSPEVRQAIKAAVTWFEKVKIMGLREEWRNAPGALKGKDKVMVPDPAAGPLWARFYELETNRPFFCGRDGVKKYSLAEIEYERRNGYAWYVGGAATLLAKDYPAWQARWSK